MTNMTGMAGAFGGVWKWGWNYDLFFFGSIHVVPCFAKRRATCDAVCAVSSFAILNEC